MTAPTAPTASPPESAALWEDFLEIFIKPSAVFERRKASGFVVPLLVLTVVIALLWFGMRDAMAPIIEADTARTMAKAMAKNPQITEEVVAQQVSGASRMTPIFGTLAVPVIVLLVGLFTWLAGKMVGAAMSLGAAMMIATYSYFPKVVGFLAAGAQVLLLPEDQITGGASVSVGPARAFDPDTASTLLVGTLVRLDLFTLWVTWLIAVGIHVVAKVPMGKALIAAGIVWLVGHLPTLVGGLVAG